VTEMIGTLASASTTSSVVLSTGSNLITGASGSTTFAGTISGAGTLTKVGTTSAFTLSGSNTYTGPTVISQGTLTVNGSLQTATNSVNLDDASSVLNGTGTVLRPVIATSTGSGSKIGDSSSSLTITNVGGTGIDVQQGANNVTITDVTATGNNIGMLIEPGSGNETTITGSTITSNTTGLEVLNGCITATGNIIGGTSGKGNNDGVLIPATNPVNAALPVNPLLTLELNNISWNMVGLQNSSSVSVSAMFNWWGNAAGPGPVDGMGRNPVVGVSTANYTPFAVDTTSVGPNPSTSKFSTGTGSDGNVYVAGSMGADNITATVDSSNPNVIHVTVANASGTTSNTYTRGSSSNRLIIYAFGSTGGTTHDSITVSGSWDAEIHSGPGNNRITTVGTGSDVIFGGGNDIIVANTSGNNVIVEGLSTGKTGAPAAPQMSAGRGANIFIAGDLGCSLAPMSASGRFDYATLRAIDDAWAAGTMGGMADAMLPGTIDLFNAANTPGDIMTGTARAVITPGTGKSWFVVKGANNPVNTPAGLDTDYVAGSTANPNFRQAIK
jgi:fibronectin-binding autotransporter adhesin